jgi:2,4-dienoyl-CoA reductase (NADPH2)
LHIDRLFYPELPQEAMVKGLDWGRHGKGIVVPYATEVKKAVSIPVYVASRLDPELGEALLRQGKLDLVGMTRRLLADPELPHKVAEGRLDDIVPCAGCNYCWHTRIQNKPVKCRMNAALGREIEMTITPAEEKKRVLVVGGGPAGMEAARVAALRGHEVTLCDREVRLGGSMSVAALVKDYEREKILDQIGYLKAQLKKLGVKLKLGKEISSPLVEATKADVVILATGGLPHVPDIPGIQSPKVVNNYKLHRMLKRYMRFFGPNLLAWLTKFWMPVGKNVVIIGGALHGCQLGEFLAKHGRRVTIVDESAKLGDGLLSDDPVRLFRWFQKKGVVLMPAVKYRRITDEGLVLTNNKGRELTLQADTIITALPLKPDTEIAKKLAGGNRVKVYQIGDCRSPAYMPDAIADGFEAALKI